MKNVYSSLQPKTGHHVGGTCKILLAPREWLINAYTVNFSNGKITTQLSLISGKSWLTMDLVEDSYRWEETAKSNNAGTYYEKSIGGLINYMDPELLQLLETLRYHEFVVQAKDKKKQWRVTGNAGAGMLLQYNNSNNNNQGGNQIVAIDLQIQEETSSPFYDIVENFTDVVWINNYQEVPYPALVFSGGNLIGATEFEIFNTPAPPATVYTETLAAGENAEYRGLGAWPDLDTSLVHKVRWRKQWPDGTFTAWAEKTLIVTD